MASYSVNRDKLYEAFDLYSKEFCDTLPSDEELGNISFSDEFEEKMRKLIEKQKKFYYYWVNPAGKRAAAIIAALFVGLTAVTFGVKAIREPFLRFIVETFEKFSSIIFMNDDDNSGQSSISADAEIEFEAVEPSYIPEGFVLESKIDDLLWFQTTYISSNNKIVTYTQMSSNDAIVQADTEDTTYDKLQINGFEAISYSKNGTNTVVFNSDKYVFTVTGSVDMDEIIKIAESIKIP